MSTARPDSDRTELVPNPEIDLDRTQVYPTTEIAGYGLATTESSEHTVLTAIGDYRITAKLGEGAMGTVYRALRLSTNRQVALKVLPRKVAQRPGFVQRFHREVRAMGRLTHPNVVRYLAAGEWNGWIYLAMELVEGGSVGERVKRDGRLTVADAMAVAVATGRALDHAHRNKFIHRDVKPDNLLISTDGQVKLADLGLGKTTDDTEVNLTGTGTGMGTPLYAPVEQIRDAKRADARSDLYALGGVLYFALTGAAPYAGLNFLELLKAKEKGGYVPASKKNAGVPTEVDKMLSKLLARLPEHRYQSAEEFLQDAEWSGYTTDRITSKSV